MEESVNRELLYAAAKIEAGFYSRSSNASLGVRTGTGFVINDPASPYPYVVTNRHVTDYLFANRAPDYSAALGEIRMSGHYQPTSDLKLGTQPWKLEIKNPNVNYHPDESIDLAVIRFAGTVEGGGGQFVPAVTGEPTVQTLNNFHVEVVATSEQLDLLNPGTKVLMSGYPAVAGSVSDRPLVVSGIVASDPRYPASFGGGTKNRSVLTHSFSWSGMSGAAVLGFADSMGGGKLIGVNAGHFSSRDESGTVISHFVRADVITEIVRQFVE